MAGDQNLISAKRIAVTERFEKTRLALISYSSIGIVLAFAATGKDASMPGWSGIHLNVDILGWLVFAASLAYFLVFILSDIPASSALNRQILQGVTWDKLDAHIQSLQQSILFNAQNSKELSDRLISDQSQALGHLQVLHDNLIKAQSHEVIKALEDYNIRDDEYQNKAVFGPNNPLQRGIANPPLVLQKHITAQIDWIRQTLLSFNNVRELRSNDNTLLADFTDSIRVQVDALEDIKAKLNHFDASLARGEVSRYLIWECAAPIILFSIALFATGLRAIAPEVITSIN